MTIQEQLEAEQKAHKATQDKLTKAEADTKTAVERAEKAEAESSKIAKAEADAKTAQDESVKLKDENKKLADENKKLAEDKQKLADENKKLADKDQDLDKRANAKFREFASAQGLNPDAAPKVTGSKQPGQGGTSTRAQLLEQYNALTDAQARADFYAANEKAMFGRN